MAAGIHGAYEWEVNDGRLQIFSSTPKVGVLLELPISRGFDNAEQVQWFVQGQIDTRLEELERLEAARIEEQQP